MPDNELLEASLKMNIKSIIKDADKVENLYEKKDLLVSAHDYAEKLTDKTLLNETSDKIAKVDEELKTLTEKGLKTDKLEENVKNLEKENLIIAKDSAKLEEEKNSIKEKYEILSKMYEEKQFKASKIELERNHNLSKEVCSLKLKARKQENTILSLKRENRLLKEKMDKLSAMSNGKVDAEIVKDLNEQIEELTNKNVRLSESLKSLRKEKLESVNRTSRFSRFEEAKNRLPKRDSIMKSSTIVENKEFDDEDAKMEKMLSGNI